MNGLIIIGSGGHARVIVDILRARNELDRLVGLIDNITPIGNYPDYCHHKVIGHDEDLDIFSGFDFIIGIGGIRGGVGIRSLLFDRAIAAGLRPTTMIHPTAILAEDVVVGAGSVIMAGVIVNTGSCIGHNVILNTRCTLDHDVVIADHVNVAPCAAISGNCRIGDSAFIGVGAVLRQKLEIGSGSTVGAGAVVVGNVNNDTTVMGVPARPKGLVGF